jgi:RNA polymerase sigma-70 factor, ECF subfamily
MADSSAVSARRQSFERIVAPYRDDLFRYVFWLCRDPDLADDVVQETMLRAFKSLESLEDEAASKTWLLTIARREHARAYERKRLETRDIDTLTAAEAALIASPDDDTDILDMRATILSLDVEYREPLVLQVLFGVTTKEIAAMLGITQGAVLTRLHRARKKLVERIGPELGSTEG